MDKLRDENKSLRETIKKSACPNCGFATSSRDSSVATEEQQLRIENARLKSEVRQTRLLNARLVLFSFSVFCYIRYRKLEPLPKSVFRKSQKSSEKMFSNF